MKKLSLRYMPRLNICRCLIIKACYVNMEIHVYTHTNLIKIDAKLYDLQCKIANLNKHGINISLKSVIYLRNYYVSL